MQRWLYLLAGAGVLYLLYSIPYTNAEMAYAPENYVLVVFNIECERDFDPAYWRAFDALMAEEWNIQSVSICPSWDGEYQKYVLGMISENVIVVNSTRFFTDDHHTIHGTAWVTINRGHVTWNGEAATGKAVSHEVLHLVLEERGYPHDIYVKRVHKFALSYRIKTVRIPARSGSVMVSKKIVIVQRFDLD